MLFGGSRKRTFRISHDSVDQLSNEQRVCDCLGYIEDYTTQLCDDYNKPLTSIMESKRFVFVAQLIAMVPTPPFQSGNISTNASGGGRNLPV